jgi:hypothetical protein
MINTVYVFSIILTIKSIGKFLLDYMASYSLDSILYGQFARAY